MLFRSCLVNEESLQYDVAAADAFAERPPAQLASLGPKLLAEFAQAELDRRLAKIAAERVPADWQFLKLDLESRPISAVAALKAENDQLKAALQEAIQHAQDAQQDADKAMAEAQSKDADKDIKEDEIAIKAYDSLTKRIQVLGATITPEQVQAIVMQTLGAAQAQPQPSEEAQDMTPDENGFPAIHDGMDGEQMGEMGAQMDQPEQPQANPVQDLLTGQEQLAVLIGHLIKLVQAPRERIPERGKDGSIVRVVDRLAEMPTEGPMQ